MSSAEARPLDAAAARSIARAFLPASRLGSRWNYHYVQGKLRSDPLYPGIADALRGTRAPLLDLGCGLGLLAHTLRADGIALPYRGVDVDAGKIAKARQAATRAGLADVAFDTVDLARQWPAHSGSVAILDVLQYLAPEAQVATLDAAIGMLAPGGRLVIRTGLDDGGPRARFTHFADVVGRLSGWMYSSPRRYPQAEALRTRLEAAGLAVAFVPLRGNTPFNNWRIVAERLG
ncbi:MAG: methyltransferase domain-containing protein [Pseudomonadota bacterium]